MLPKELYKRIPVILLYAAAALAALWLAVRYALPAISPFIAAWMVAALLQPVMRRIRGGRVRRRVAAACLVLACVGILALLCFLAASRVYRELSELAQNAADLLRRAREDESFAAGIIKRINSAVPFFDIEDWLTGVWNNIDSHINSAAADIISGVTSVVLPLLNALIRFLPGAFLYAFVLALSSYYMTVEFDGVNRALVSLLPKRARRHLSAAAPELSGTVKSMLRAYAILFLMTFFELFAAFSLMRTEYPLVEAFLIAVFDILPVLGAGVILVPWGVISLLMGETARGFALLTTFGVMTVIREIAEPKLVGKSIGVPPLLTLVSMYAGLKLFGVPGMILTPPAVAVARDLVRSVRRNRASAPQTDAGK